MRIYDGSPRQDWEEVLRSVGAYLDRQGMRGLIFMETETGFIIQGTAVHRSLGPGESIGQASRETLVLNDEDVSKFLDEAVKHRGANADETLNYNENNLRVLGRYFDEHKPRELFFFELEGAYIARLQVAGQGGLRHELAEFTQEDIAGMIARAPELRRQNQPQKK